MNCSICYENFVNPEDFEPEEFRKMIKESNWTNGVYDYKKSYTFQNLTAPPIKCNTNNCEVIFCLGCYYKIKRSASSARAGIEEDEYTGSLWFDDNDIFKCPYCRGEQKDYGIALGVK